MRREKSHPSWWQLYLLVLGTIGLLLLGALAPLSERWHEVAAIGTLLLVWGLVELWLRANTPALLHVSEQILVAQPRPKAEGRMPDDEREPAPATPQQAGGQWATEGALAFREREGTAC